MNAKYSLAQKSRLEVQEFLKENPVVILPIGATEQHGYHLPLGTDFMLAEHLSYLIAEKAPALVAPPLPFGYSWVWRDIPGTMSLKQSHLQLVLKDLAHSCARWGTKLFVVVSGHEANNATMKYACREFADESPCKFLHLFYPNISEIYKKHCVSPTWGGMFHADEFETSLMLETAPDLVHMERAVVEYPQAPLLYGSSSLSLGDISKSGVYGDPVPASRDKGSAMMSAFAEESGALIKSFLYQQ